MKFSINCLTKMPKQNAAYLRRQERFRERLQKTGCQTNTELKELNERHNARQQNSSRVNRRERREAGFWEIARRNKARKEAQVARHAAATSNFRPTQTLPAVPEIICLPPPKGMEYSLKKILVTAQKFSNENFMKMVPQDPRNTLFYEIPTEPIQQQVSTIVVPTRKIWTIEEEDRVATNAFGEDVLVLDFEEDFDL